MNTLKHKFTHMFIHMHVIIFRYTYIGAAVVYIGAAVVHIGTAVVSW